jgi:hypothetical protein
MQWLRKAAEKEHTQACLQLASDIYGNLPYARDVGHTGQAAGVAPSVGIMGGHDVPPDVLTGVVHWLRKGGHDPAYGLNGFRRMAFEGCKYCYNAGCEVMGHLKDFKVCPQCKTARYCSAACQKQDWNAGGHKETCGTAAAYQGGR